METPQDLTVAERIRGKFESLTRGLGAFWATHIKGDQVVLELFTPGRSSGAAWGYSIDRYAAGTVNLGAGAPESICSPDDRRNAVCYQGSEPDAYDHGRAVARLLVEGTLLCTGFLVGCEGHLFTNNHCFDDPDLSEPDPRSLHVLARRE